MTKNERNIESTADFIKKLKKTKIEGGYKMVSLDVVSLFTSVPLDYTIKIILDKVYQEEMIRTKLSRDELQSLLELCTKEMHFSYNGKIFKQTNGVAMGSPLGPVLANIFMVHLEEKMIPQLTGKMSSWYRYVDDTFTFIKDGEAENVKETLNKFHTDIKFTYESESNGSISFLDVKVNRKIDGTFDTAVYRKDTDNSIYINWNAFATRQWKIGTLKGLFRRAFLVCSTEDALETELNYLKKVFTKTNGYPSKIVSKTLEEIKKKVNERPTTEESTVQLEEQSSESEGNERAETNPYICLPYRGVEGEKVLRKFKSTLRQALPNHVKPRFTYKGTKLGSFFSVKDKVDKRHQTNLVYGYTPKGGSELKNGYIGETNVRYETRTYQHAATDKASSVYKNAQTNNIEVSDEDFVILERGFPKYRDRKIAEALYIKDFNPVLNGQQYSYKLKLFN